MTRPACVLVLCLFWHASAAAAQFETRSVGATVPGPWGAVVGDFNRDGKLDLLVSTCIDANQVAIMLGNGDGTFQRPVTYTLEACPDLPAIGDFNGDGNLDVAVTVYKYGSVSDVAVLLGEGDGTFEPPVYYPTPPVPCCVQVGDFNNDHKLDLVTMEPVPNVLTVLLGNGDGTFQPYIETPLPAEDSAITVGDFNNDGNLDVAAALGFGSQSSVQIMLGNGNGTFTYSASYPVLDPTAILAARLIPGGDLDLVAVNGDFVNISVLLGNGDGTFRAAVNYKTQDPVWAAVSDLNGDGIPDLVAVNFNQPAGASVFLGNGDGTFRTPTLYATGEESRFVGIGDLNGDHRPDLVVPSWGSGNVRVLLNTGAVSFSPTTPLNFKTQTVGTTSPPQTVTLTNTGTKSLTISTMRTQGQFGMKSSCGKALAVGAKCSVRVTFSPTSAGQLSGTVSINDSASTKPQVILMTGIGKSN